MTDPNLDRQTIREIQDKWLEPPTDEEEFDEAEYEWQMEKKADAERKGE